MSPVRLSRRLRGRHTFSHPPPAAQCAPRAAPRHAHACTTGPLGGGTPMMRITSMAVRISSHEA